MKITTIISKFLIALAILLSACTKEEYFYSYDKVSQYELDKAIVQISTTNVATGFETVFSDLIPDSASRAQFCQAFVMPVRFFDNEAGYFFVESYNAWMIIDAAKPELTGQYRYDVQDANGKFYVQEMVSTIKYIGYGFVEYFFENPVTNNIERKLSFVKSIPAAEFFIGAGFYENQSEKYYEQADANKQIVIESTRTAAEGIAGVFENYYTDTLDRVEFCRKFIDHIRFFDNQSGYFFIYDFECVNVAHGIQKNLQGQDLYDYQDSHGNYVIRELVNVAKNHGEGYYEYYWNNPVTSQEEPKLAWVIKIPGIDYFIGSGIYLD